MRRALISLLAGVLVLQADERTQRLTERLAEEAAAFAREAPRLIGAETLRQRAVKPSRRFRLRVGSDARRPAEPEWQSRAIASDYGFSVFADGVLHELRQVNSVDGKPVKSPGPEALARIILAPDDQRKRELLRQFERHGLLGAVTDFGPLLLLFQPSAIGGYEFDFVRNETLHGIPAQVFSYQQLEGAPGVTVMYTGRRDARAVPAQGEVWVRTDTYAPLRIVVRSDLPGGVRQEAEVDYAPSRFATVLPIATRHREYRDGRLHAQNDFEYSGFQRFGASADIVFEAEPEDLP